MAIKVTHQVSLDPEAVDHILVTALDGKHGGSHYWMGEEDDLIQYEITRAQQADGDVLWVSAEFCWRGADFEQSINAHDLEQAWAKALDQHGNTETARQLREVLDDPDGYLGNLDAEGADFLLQLALFNEVRYG